MVPLIFGYSQVLLGVFSRHAALQREQECLAPSCLYLGMGCSIQEGLGFRA